MHILCSVYLTNGVIGLVGITSTGLTPLPLPPSPNTHTSILSGTVKPQYILTNFENVQIYFACICYGVGNMVSGYDSLREPFAFMYWKTKQVSVYITQGTSIMEFNCGTRLLYNNVQKHVHNCICCPDTMAAQELPLGRFP